MEESKKFWHLERAEKCVIDKLKNDYRTKRHKNLAYSFNNSIKEVVYQYYERTKFSIRCVTNAIDNYSAEVLLYGNGVNHKFSFDARKWIREDKLKKLL